MFIVCCRISFILPIIFWESQVLKGVRGDISRHWKRAAPMLQSALSLLLLCFLTLSAIAVAAMTFMDLTAHRSSPHSAEAPVPHEYKVADRLILVMVSFVSLSFFFFFFRKFHINNHFLVEIRSKLEQVSQFVCRLRSTEKTPLDANVLGCDTVYKGYPVILDSGRAYSLQLHRTFKQRRNAWETVTSWAPASAHAGGAEFTRMFSSSL